MFKITIEFKDGTTSRFEAPDPWTIREFLVANERQEIYDWNKIKTVEISGSWTNPLP